MTANHAHPTPRVRAGGNDRNQWWLVAVAALAVFMASVDMSIVTVALPVIETDLDIDTSMTEWVALAYLLPLAGLALPAARWLDTVGRRPALAFSVGGFALASLTAGLAPDLAWLLGARVAQGSFGAMLFALVPALATTAVQPQARGRAMGLITTLGPLGLVSGPVLGGVIIDSLDWSWIFFVNLPASLVVLVVGVRMLPADLPLRAPDRAWFVEAMLLSVAIAALLLSLTLTAGKGTAWLLLAALAVPLLAGWWRLSASAPVRRLLRAPEESGPHLALALAATAIGVVFFVTPFFLQRSLDQSAAAAGVIMLAFPAGMALTGPIGGFVGDRWGWRRTALLGATGFTVGLALLAPMDSSWDPGDVAWRLLLAGCGNGLFNAPNMATAMSRAPTTLLATTGATTSLARQAGFALGPAIATLAWALSQYQPVGMAAAVLLGTVLSAASVAALLCVPASRTRNPSEPPPRLAASTGTRTEPEESQREAARPVRGRRAPSGRR